MNYNFFWWFNDKPTIAFIAYVANFNYLTGSLYKKHIFRNLNINQINLRSWQY